MALPPEIAHAPWSEKERQRYQSYANRAGADAVPQGDWLLIDRAVRSRREREIEDPVLRDLAWQIDDPSRDHARKRINSRLAPLHPTIELLREYNSPDEPVRTMAQAEVEQELDAPVVSNRVQGDLYDLDMADRQVDPAIEAFQQAREVIRSGQAKDIEQFSSIMFDQPAVSERRALSAARQMAATAGARGDNPMIADAYTASSREAVAPLMGALGEERAGQRRAIQAASSGFTRQWLNDTRLTQGALRDELSRNMRRESIAGEVLANNARSRAARIQDLINRAETENIKIVGKDAIRNPRPNDYVLPVISAVTNAAATGASLYERMGRRQEEEDISAALRDVREARAGQKFPTGT